MDDIFNLDSPRLGALEVIDTYLDDLDFAECLQNFKWGLSEEEIERYSNMKWTLKELRRLIMYVDEPPLIIIERFGRKLKQYNKDFEAFEDSLPVCDTVINLLGGTL